jgi:adenosylcobinamide hydrolase
MILYTMPSGDRVRRQDDSIVVEFGGKRSVISTCHLNGGYREDLMAVYNDNSDHRDCHGNMTESMFVELMKARARELGLDAGRTAAMGTAVHMDNAVIKSMEYSGLSVTAIVTGGIENNGGRAGDPASFFERDGKVIPVGGTINIILEINARTSPYALTRAIVTLTEAKTAAIQELMLGSCYSTGIATGSGTDQVIVYGNDQSDLSIVYTGKHSKAGELIGRVVKEAVKEALLRHQEASPASQHSMLKRLKRYKITEDRLWDTYASKDRHNTMDKPEFIDKIHRIDGTGEIVTLTSLYLHLLDQAGWGLISDNEAIWAGNIVLDHICNALKLGDVHAIESSGDLTKDMLEAYARAVSEGVARTADIKEK